MHYPKLEALPTTRQMTTVFRGYNHNLHTAEGEFYDMKNMTSDCYPILAPRGKRGIYAAPEACQGIIAKDTLCYVDGGDFLIGQERVDLGLTQDGPKQLISMGAYVLILPDKKYVNTADLTDRGGLEARVQTAGEVSVTPCRADGSACQPEFIQDAPPEDPANNTLWVDTSSTPHALKQWSESSGMWVAVATTYVKLASQGIGAPFARYDGVQISGLAGQGEQLEALEGAAVVWDRGEDYLVVTGLLDQAQSLTAALTVSRTMPLMDYVVEAGNRLWGCRYGLDENGAFVNCLYASKLGDFKNWRCFMGLSTDSYYVNLGTDGKFTGAITHLGYPLFFKEGCMHKVYGSFPAEIRVQDTACRGVQDGCSRSLAIVNEILYYKSRHGVCAYDGSLPVEISAALGDVCYDSAVAGGHGNKYYLSMRQVQSGEFSLFVYDTARGLWHREDGLRAEGFCSAGAELYCLEHGGRILALLGSGEPAEGHVDWMVQTGVLGSGLPDRKYLSRLNVRMSMDVGGRARFFVQYDSMGGWEHLGTVNVTSLKSFTLPIRPRRCDHLRLRIEGSGDARIYAITQTVEQGSDLS